MADEKPPTPEQAVKAVRILGGINLVLGAYMLLGVLMTFRSAELPQLPAVARQLTKGFGLIIALVAWGSALVSGIGLLMRAAWGRTLGLFWGRVIVWILPIGFGLKSSGLGDFISLEFAIIIVICFYGNVVAQNLKRPEFDVAFE